ncbi:MAG: hypothetical protein EOM10_11190, partial [Opitutae bacterium]|nr:hypothetical protein [Opitutae bacterium]
LMLRHGQVAAIGPANEVVQAYIRSAEAAHVRDGQGYVALHDRLPAAEHMHVVLQAARLVDDRERAVSIVRTGDVLRMDVQVAGLNRFPAAVVGFTVRSIFDQKIFHFNTAMAGGFDAAVRHAAESVRIEIPDLPLVAGSYAADLQVFEPAGRWIDRVAEALRFDVVESDLYGHGYRGETREGLIAVRGDCRIALREEAPRESAP